MNKSDCGERKIPQKFKEDVLNPLYNSCQEYQKESVEAFAAVLGMFLSVIGGDRDEVSIATQAIAREYLFGLTCFPKEAKAIEKILQVWENFEIVQLKESSK